MSLSQDLIRTALRPLAWVPGGTTRVARDIAQPQPRHQVPNPPPRSLQRLATITRHEVAGRPVLRVEPRHDPTGHQVLFWHGGGWSLEISALQWFMVQRLMQRTGATFWVPSYGLAPSHTLTDAVPLVDGLNEHVPRAGRRFVIAGDSAGGHLSLVSALRARETGARPADHLLLYSPGLDLRFANPDAPAVERADPLLRVKEAKLAGAAWAGDLGVDHPLASPLLADLAGLPPMDLFSGDADVLYPDAVLFAQRVREAGGDIHTTFQPGGFHDYSLAQITPESRRDVARSAQVILGEL